MRYYKVISKKLIPAFEGRYTYDNIYSFYFKKGVRVACQYVAEELITPGELKKFYGISAENMHLFPFLEAVDVPKTNTHHFFGVRFENDRPIYRTATGDPFEA